MLDFRVAHHETMALVDFFFGLHVDSIVIQKWHLALALRRNLHDNVDVRTTQAAPDGTLAGLDDFETQELLVEAPREIEVLALERPVRQELEFECRIFHMPLINTGARGHLP